VFEKPVHARQYGHGHTARETTLDSRRDGIRFKREQSPRQIWRDWKSFDFVTVCDNARNFHFHFDRFFFLLWEDVPEPADAPSQKQDRPENADCSIGDEASHEQRDTECKSYGPSRRRRQMDRAA
jgi:hypothetical protein